MGVMIAPTLGECMRLEEFKKFEHEHTEDDILWLGNVASNVIAAISHRERREESSRFKGVRRAQLPLGAGPAGWEYRILDLDHVQSVTHVPLGGTHASPRWHIRRGHYRQLPDRMVPVRECEVGDKTRGGVVKDYRKALPAHIRR